MGKHEIAVIRGDGIGPEVIEEGIKVLNAAQRRFGVECTYTEFPWGSDYYFEHGTMMDANGLDTLRGFDAVFFGAVGHPDIQDHVTLNGLLLPMRRGFDQYVCQRPSILLPGVTSPLRDMESGDIDMVVIREKHGGRVRQRRRLPVQGLPGGGRGADLRIHSARHRARCSLLLRVGALAQQEAPPRLHHEVERPGLRNGALGRGSSTRSRPNTRTSRPSRCSWTRRA